MPSSVCPPVYGLQRISPGQVAKLAGRATLRFAADRPVVPPRPRESLRVLTPLQQGLFVIDEAGVVRYTYVASPASFILPPAKLLEVVDGLAP